MMAPEPNSCTDKVRVELDFRIEAGNWPALEILESMIDSTFATLMDNRSFCQVCKVMDGSEVSLLFTDDSHITRINGEFRGQEKPTNVLSFPQQEADCDVFGPYLGDIVLAFETIFREADLEKKDFNHHLQHLMVHGFLHLVGYDHETDDEAAVMESLEIDILRDLNIDDPYKDMTDK
ncbi:MAG: rRNA maturation RNase YbeY [Hyphomicrobiales bacterium]